MDKLTPEGRIELELQLIAEKKLLPSKQGKRPDVPDPFEGTVKRIIKKNPALAKSATEPQDDEITAKFTTKKKPKKE